MKREKTKEEIEREELVLELADELGLSEKIIKAGLRGLTSKESGRIGGLISGKIRREKKEI